jgi:thioredoxin
MVYDRGFNLSGIRSVGYVFPQMKMLPMILFLVLCVSGCDSIKKAKEFAKQAAAAAEKQESADSAPVEGGAVHKVTADSFEEFTDQGSTLVVVDFYADWCGPCKRLAPMLDKLAVEYGDRVVVGKLDVDAYGGIAKKAGVRGIPDVRFYRDGKQVDKLVGLPPERELRSRFERHMEGKLPQLKEEKKERDAQTATALETPKKAEKEKGPKQPDMTTDEKEPEKPKEPVMQPMKKDWMPPGMERR